MGTWMMKKTEPILHIKQSDLDKKLQEIYKTAQNDIISELFALLLGLPVKVLFEQFGWTGDELTEFGEAVLGEYERFDDSDMSLEYLQDLIFELTGIKFMAVDATKNNQEQHHEH